MVGSIHELEVGLHPCASAFLLGFEQETDFFFFVGGEGLHEDGWLFNDYERRFDGKAGSHRGGGRMSFVGDAVGQFGRAGRDDVGGGLAFHGMKLTD